jgi:hypothetical protein
MRENYVWVVIAVQTTTKPAPARGGDMIAQHEAEGEVLGRVGKRFESLGDAEFSRHTIARAELSLGHNDAMTGIQFVTDGRGRKVAVLIDLKKHGARLEDLWDGLVSESRRKEKGIPLAKVKADLIKRGRLRG